MPSLSEHPNFKHIIKNRLLSSVYPFVIKNSKGNYVLERTLYLSTNDIRKSKRYEGAGNGIILFGDAKNINGRVFVTTHAGEIEIFEKDFQ